MTLFADALNRRQGEDISDEEVSAYGLGFQDALDALLSDEVYYALGAKQTFATAIERAVAFVKTGISDY